MRKNRPVIELPRIIDIQYNAIENTLETLNRLNLKGKALIVADEVTEKIAGQRVFEIVENSFEVENLMISLSIVAIDSALHQSP